MAKTILIVDDDFEDVLMLEETLRDEGYEVVSLLDSEKAIRKARELRPDLIILDEVMPKMFGSEIGLLLSEDSRTKDIPLLFLTALKTPEDPLTSNSSGNTVVAKSTNTRELLETIEHMIG